MRTGRLAHQLGVVPVKANGFISRLRGINAAKAKCRGAVLIFPCHSIHTFFMNYSIDVFFLDDKKRVLAGHREVPPFRVLACLGAHYVLETLPNMISGHVELGDVICC